MKQAVTVIPTEPSTFYPEVTFSVTGTNVKEGPFMISLMKTLPIKQIKKVKSSISPDGKVTVSEGAVPGEVQVWAEVVNDGKIFKTDKLTVTIVDHAEQTTS